MERCSRRPEPCGKIRDPFRQGPLKMAVRTAQSEEIGLLWGQVLESVRARIGSHQAFETWFKPMVPRLVSPEVVELEVPNAFFIDWLHEHHLPLLHASLESALGATPAVRFTLSEPQAAAPAAARPAPAPTPGSAGGPRRPWLDHQPRPRPPFPP